MAVHEGDPTVGYHTRAIFVPPVTITGTTHTVDAANGWAYHRCTNAAGCSITVPDDLDAPDGHQWTFVGTLDQLTFVEDTSVTINVPASATLLTLEGGAAATLVKVGANEYDLHGSLEPA